LLEFGAVGIAAGFLVGEYLVYTAVPLSKLAELVQLVLGVLAFVFRRHAGISSYSHLYQL
jgi:hypothetical protein